MSENKETTEVKEEQIKRALQKRAKAQREQKEQHEQKKREKTPKVSRLEQRREANRRAAERAEAGLDARYARDDDDDDDDDDEGSSSDGEEGSTAAQQGQQQPKKKTLFGSPAVKVACLAALVPLVVGVPFAVTRLCALLERLPDWVLAAVWAVYAVAVAAVLLGPKRHKATWDSVLTHNSIYVIFSFGAYYFMHIADNVPIRHRRRSLLVWNTITMLLNIVMMVVDDTDYQQQQRDERARQRRHEERRKRREEQRKQQQQAQEGKEEHEHERKRRDAWYNRNRFVRVAMDALVYIGFAFLVYLAVCGLRRYKRNFDARIREGRAPNEERTWGYESRTGADWKPDVHDDDLDSAHVGATAATDDVEWHPTLRDEDLE